MKDVIKFRKNTFLYIAAVCIIAVALIGSHVLYHHLFTPNAVCFAGAHPFEETDLNPDAVILNLNDSDFEVKILEYYDHVYNKSSVLSMNYSEIVEENYTDIPTLIDTESNDTASYCNFSMNLSLYNQIFLKNESVREMLRDGGLIVITYTDKARCTHPDNCDPCQWFNIAMDILYKGEWYEARIFNESNGNVDQIHHGGKTDVPYSVFSF